MGSADDSLEIGSRTGAPRDALGAPSALRLCRGDSVGRYVVLDLVGVGATGNVYCAADPALRRNVALKLVRSTADRLIHEARLLAQVVHPNVVAVHDVGRYDGHLFIAMDLVEGQTVGEWLTTRRSTPEILRVFVAAGRGLAAAHAAGVVHRDFKPENVLLGDGGRVVVGDFGLARAGSAPRDTGIVGTPAYMAPEQSEGHTADHRADQYSFCVALHEALLGARPPSPPADNRTLPGHVRRALRRGLAKRPEDRHPSMDALLSALADVPGKRVRWIALAAAAVIAATVLLVLRARQHAREVEACRSVAHRLDGVWDEARKERIHAAFRATNQPYAEDAWSSVTRTIDAYAAQWTAGHAAACEATRVRHEQPAAVFDLRGACYAERFEELRAVVDVLEAADAKLVRTSVAIAHELAPQAPCERVLPTMNAPDAAIAPAVARLRGDIVRSRALRDAGRLEEGKRLVERATADSAALGFLPLEAAALVDLAMVQSRMGDKPLADATLTRAIRIADSARDDGSRLRALSQRMFIASSRATERHADAAAALDADASAVLKRLGGDDPRAEETYRYNAGMTFLALRDFDRATAEMTRSATLAADVYGPSSADAARAESGVCLVAAGKEAYEDAVKHCRVAAETFATALGRKHPEYALAVQNLGALMLELNEDEAACAYIEEGYEAGLASLGGEHLQVVAGQNNFGACLTHRGDHARAIAMLEPAAALRERIQGPTHPDVARPLTNLGRAYLAAGSPDRAVAPLERAVRLRKDGAVGPDDVAVSAFALARALWDSGKDRRRARELAEEARDLFARADARTKPSPRGVTERADVARWLKAPEGR